MKKLKKGFFAILLSMLFVAVTPNILPNNAGMEYVEAASSVKLSASKVTLIKGQTKKLKISGTSKKIKWSSNKQSVATVSSNGKVTAVKKGTAKITAKVGGKKYTCKVTVENPKINKTSANIAKGDTLKLKISGTSQTVKWSSSKKSVAKVNSNGKVTAKKAGTATITATVGGEKEYTCKVTVKNVGEMSAANTSISMKDNASTKKVKITVSGANSRDCTIYYSIDDTSIVSCSWGNWSGETIPLKITPKKMGSTTIRITNTLSSKTCSIKVNVTSSVVNYGEVSVSSSSVSMKDNETKNVTITLPGANKYGGTVSYSVDDTSIVSCSLGSRSGDTYSLTIKPRGVGSTSIKITNTLSSKTCSIKVTVTSAVTIEMPDTPVTINYYSSSGARKQTCQVENVYYTVKPSGSRYYYKIYVDGIKTYDSSGSNYSQKAPIGYKIYNSNGAVVDSGIIYTASISTGESFEGAWSNGYLDAGGDYTLELLSVK